MGQNWHIAGNDHAEKELLQLRRRRVVRWLNKHVAGISERKQAPGSQPADEIRAHMDVRAGDQTKRDCLCVERFLQPQRRPSDCRTGIQVKPG